MAGDWIKMRHNLETDPDVLRIAELVNVDRFSVVGRLHMIWVWADQHSLDGCAIRATASFLDAHVCCAGFCEALRTVGWLDGEDWDLSFPNFDRHNGETAKKRAQAKKSMAKKRCANVAQNAQPEKRREEKSNTHTHTPSHDKDFVDLIDDRSLQTKEFIATWKRWIEWYNSQNSRPMNDVRAHQDLIELSRRGHDKAIADLAFTIRKGAAKSILDSDNDFEKRQGASRSGGQASSSKYKPVSEITGRKPQ